jgi:hypothetical protein
VPIHSSFLPREDSEARLAAMRKGSRRLKEMHRALFANDLSTGASTNGEGSDVVGL